MSLYLSFGPGDLAVIRCWPTSAGRTPGLLMAIIYRREVRVVTSDWYQQVDLLVQSLSCAGYGLSSQRQSLHERPDVYVEI
jgi:hypothetical protein